MRLEGGILDVLFTFPGQPKILILPLIWYLMLYLNDGWDKSKFLNSPRYYSDIFDAAWKSLIIFSAIAFLLQYPISRLWVFYNSISIPIVLLINRLILRKLFNKKIVNYSKLKYIYIGEKRNSKIFQEEFKSLFGYLPKFIFLNPPTPKDSAGWMEKYKALIKPDLYGVVISYASISDAQLLKEIANYKRDNVIDLILISRIAPIVQRFEILENPTLIRIRQSSLFSSGAFLKRLIDIIGSLLGIIVLSPIFLITALMIKSSSRGLILFTDRRIGKDGQMFTFPKFRSMYKGAEFRRQDFIGKPDSLIADRYKKDPRVTPIGRFIRRWSIDELPQLWCVLVGTMSLVGPRPILLEEKEIVDPLHTDRFLAKPGLTGLWQITGRKEVAWEDRMLRDLAYIENWSLGRDVIYIAKTFRAIIKGQGAF
jgi:exopolysaccharide biosynthesis polyprenyl glycosylphosphotransferase